MQLFGFEINPRLLTRLNPVQVASLLLLLPLYLHATTLLNLIPLFNYDASRVVVLICFALASAWLCWHQPRLSLSRWQVFGWLAVVWLVLFSWFMNHQQSSLLEALLVIGAVSLGIQYHQALKRYGTQGVLAILLWSLAFAAVFYSVNALAVISSHCINDLDCLYYDTGPLGFGNRRLFNDLQAFMIPALLWLVVQERSPRGLKWLLLLAAWQLTYLYITGGRATILGVAAGVLGTALLIGWQKYQWQRLAGVFLLSGLIYAFLWWLNGGEGLTIRTSSSGRIDIWLQSLAAGWQSPLWGKGPGHIASLGFNAAHAHNILVEVFYAYGLPALLLLLAFLLKLALHSWQQRIIPHWLLLAGLMSFWLLANAYGPLNIPNAVILLALIFASQPYKATTVGINLPAWLFLLPALLVLPQAWQEFHQLGSYQPRIWFHNHWRL